MSVHIKDCQAGLNYVTTKIKLCNLKGKRPLPCLTFYHFKYRTLILMNRQNWKSDRNSAVMTRAGTNNQLIDRHRVNKWWKLEHLTGSARTQPIGWLIKSKAVDWLAWTKGYFITSLDMVNDQTRAVDWLDGSEAILELASWLDGCGRMIIKPEQLIGWKQVKAILELASWSDGHGRMIKPEQLIG